MVTHDFILNAELAGELRQKASAFLEKPFTPDDLTRLVREVLG